MNKARANMNYERSTMILSYRRSCPKTQIVQVTYLYGCLRDAQVTYLYGCLRDADDVRFRVTHELGLVYPGYRCSTHVSCSVSEISSVCLQALPSCSF